MGLVHLRAKRTEEASRVLARALKLAPDEPWVLTALGTVARQRGELDTATGLQRRAVERAPEKARLHGNLAITEMAAGRLPQAETAATRALELAPDDVWVVSIGASVLSRVARSRALAGELVPAAAAADRALRLAPSPLSRANRALIHLAQDQLEAAAVLAESAAKEAPELPTALYARGRVRYQRGDLSGARADFSAAYVGSKDPAAASAEGAALVRAGELDAAVDRLDAAHKAHPGDADVRLNRAVAHLLRRLGRLGRGGGNARDVNDLRLALQQEAALPPLWAARGRYAALVTQLRRKDGVAARQHLGRFTPLARKAGKRVLDGSAPKRHLEFLTAYTNVLLGQDERAAGLLTGLREVKNRASPEARLLRTVHDRAGLALLKSGRSGEAVARLKKAQAIKRTPQTSHNVAVADFQRGKKKGKDKVFRRLAAEVPEALFNLAVVLEAKGAHEPAFRAYRRYAATGGPHAAKARELADAKQRIFGFEEGK
jgi:tetratricopeptide (TPR) repeat protein